MDLEGKRLVIVAGKGGVGKTTCSAAIALDLAARGHRTLLVTIDPAKRLEDSLGVPVGFEETPIQPNLVALMLDPATVIRQHLEERVPQAKVSEHPLFKQVAGALPGLNELMAIGKLNDLRKANAYDCIVVDTAPTGHALSFLGAPKMVKDVLREGSLVRWAVRGYSVWQRLYGTARSVQNVFRSKEDRREAPPDIDFERLFAEMQQEAERIQAFLTDPSHCALVVVTVPEKLPVEETVDLHEAVTQELGMRVHALVANKVQPEALGGHEEAFAKLRQPAARRAFVQAAATATGVQAGLVDGLVDAAVFNAVRRSMNLAHLEDLAARIPDVPIHTVPLFVEEVQGLKRLGTLRKALFDDGNRFRPESG